VNAKRIAVKLNIQIDQLASDVMFYDQKGDHKSAQRAAKKLLKIIKAEIEYRDKEQVTRDKIDNYLHLAKNKITDKKIWEKFIKKYNGGLTKAVNDLNEPAVREIVLKMLVEWELVKMEGGDGNS